MLTFFGNVTVEGELVSDHPIDDWGLTMLDDQQDGSAWIYHEWGPVWNGTFVLDLELTENIVPGDDSQYRINTRLKSLWELYDVDFKRE
jgi:hypothetical protein